MPCCRLRNPSKDSYQFCAEEARGGGGGGFVFVGGVEFGRHGQQMLLSVNEEHVSMLKEV